MSSDADDRSSLVLLDLSSTVDHNILVRRIRHWVSISGIALDWLTSCLADRSFIVSEGESDIAPLFCGAPQGSVLGPLLFFLNLLQLGAIVKRYNVAYHFYADDIQLHGSFKPSEVFTVTRFLVCGLDSRKLLTSEQQQNRSSSHGT